MPRPAFKFGYMALTKSQHGCSDQPKAVHNYWRFCGILRKDGPGSIIPHKARCESLVTRKVGGLCLIPLQANLSDFQVQLAHLLRSWFSPILREVRRTVCTMIVAFMWMSDSLLFLKYSMDSRDFTGNGNQQAQSVISRWYVFDMECVTQLQQPIALSWVTYSDDISSC